MVSGRKQSPAQLGYSHRDCLRTVFWFIAAEPIQPPVNAEPPQVAAAAPSTLRALLSDGRCPLHPTVNHCGGPRRHRPYPPAACAGPWARRLRPMQKIPNSASRSGAHVSSAAITAGQGLVKRSRRPTPFLSFQAVRYGLPTVGTKVHWGLQPWHMSCFVLGAS